MNPAKEKIPVNIITQQKDSRFTVQRIKAPYISIVYDARTNIVEKAEISEGPGLMKLNVHALDGRIFNFLPKKTEEKDTEDKIKSSIKKAVAFVKSQLALKIVSYDDRTSI